MLRSIRRIILIIATSSGVFSATTLTAQAGTYLNHCETRLAG